MKKILVLGLAALTWAACSNEEVLGGGTESANDSNNGERYMAISLVANNQTRSDYADGAEDEYAVVSKDNILFYFFNSEGEAFSVTDNQTNFVKGTSFDQWTLNSGSESVTAVSNVMAVLKAKEGTMPTQVVAVVNADFTPVTMNLKGLRSLTIESGQSGKGFLMSNSVYHDGQQEVYATPIKSENLQFNADAAEANPVKIFVERTVAK